MKYALIITKKELLIAFKNSQVIVTGLIIITLLMIAGVGGYLNYKSQKEQIDKARLEKREQWLNQGDKHPHIAAHYGTFVFKPKTGLSFFDFGLDSYTGSSIYLEAHYQHEFMFRPAQDFGAMIRFGELSIALVLEFLIPLLIIFLCFSAFTQENENGTIRILAAQGVSMRALAWGKITAYSMIVFCILLPVISILMLGIFLQPGLVFTADTLWRLLVLIACYSAYFFIFIGLSVWVSSYSRTSRNALLVLLSAWILFTILIPKTSANIASNIFLLPTLADYEKAISDDIGRQIERNPRKDTLILNFTARLLKQYNVDSISQLPINYEGAYAQVYEDFSNSVHDKHAGQLLHMLSLQNKVSTYSSLINPFTAIRNISMALSSTDFYTYTDFQNEAETYRRDLVRQMNGNYRDNSRTGEFYEYKARRDLWESIKDFNFQIPSISRSLSKVLFELAALLTWTLGTAILLTYFINKSVL
ncbi:DUF3526 domain-containing protein [Dyadobacter sp. 32]|uniref:DUF3526 domain-containing protein n=1 Tax=Dyadobacter sp. 32 TaxID=538966 RepID=UPI0011EC3AAA